MAITVWALLLLFGTGAIAYQRTHDVVSTLNVLAWGFLIYMGIKLVYVILRFPKSLKYSPPVDMTIPETIDRDHVPVYHEGDRAPHTRIVANLVKAIFMKIAHAADESAIHAFVQAKIATLRRSTNERYADTISNINVIGFEGIIGTLIGLITFMAQATLLFQFPDVDPNNANTTEFVNAVTASLHKVNLWTVSTAFFTSIIGWGTKAWVGQEIDRRVGVEAASITAVETWIQDSILSRMTLPATVTTVLKFKDVGEVREPVKALIQELKWVGEHVRDAAANSANAVADAGGIFRKFNETLGPLFVRFMTQFADFKDLRFDVQYMEGGIRLVVHAPPEKGGAKTRQGVVRPS